ncbi:hypothetical protein [Bacillus sp. JCM 19034]|uniref:hypothetical protein n=1 Tax=Bacillus sp. JCM 19034 TaxID=1481928 RepID=UPI000A811EAC
MNMFMRQLGGVIGVALLGGLLNRYLRISFTDLDGELSFEPNIEEVNRILDGSERSLLTSGEQQLLQEALSGGLGYIFIALLFLAAITFILILRLPKDGQYKTSQT